jgi:hypothetical protein
MKVKIIYGEHTDEAIQRCYHYILKLYRKEKQRDIQKIKEDKKSD